VPREVMEDGEFDHRHLLGRAFLRYAPSPRNRAALETYPLRPDRNQMLPFCLRVSSRARLSIIHHPLSPLLYIHIKLRLYL
jgi:hypothetical protein